MTTRFDLAPVGDRVVDGALEHALANMGRHNLIVAVIGGIYTGLFSPTDMAAVGAAGSSIFAGVRGKLDWTALRAGIGETAGMTGMIFLILIGAALFNFFIETSGLTRTLVDWISHRGFSPLAVLVSL